MTECRAEPASTQTARLQRLNRHLPAAEVGSCDSSSVHTLGTAEIRVAAAPQSTTAAQPKSEAAAAPRSATAAQPRSEATTAPAPQAPTGSLVAGQFTTEAEREISLPGRHGRMGKYPLEGLPLRFKPQIRPHEDRRIHVRERNRSSRHQGSQEGEAPLKDFSALLLTA